MQANFNSVQSPPPASTRRVPVRSGVPVGSQSKAADRFSSLPSIRRDCHSAPGYPAPPTPLSSPPPRAQSLPVFAPGDFDVVPAHGEDATVARGVLGTFVRHTVQRRAERLWVSPPRAEASPQTLGELSNAINRDPSHVGARISRALAATVASTQGRACSGYDAAALAFDDFTFALAALRRTGFAVDPEFLGNFAYLCAVTGRFRQATGFLNEALANGSLNPEHRVLLANVLVQQGDTTRAHWLLNDILNSAHIASAWHGLGTVYALQSRHDEAVQAYAKARQAGGSSARLLLSLAKSHRALGQGGLALAAIHEALKCNRGSIEARSALVAFYIDTLDVEKAHDLANKLSSDAPDDLRVTLLKGQAYGMRGHHRSAINAFAGVLHDAEDAWLFAHESPDVQIDLQIVQRDALAGRGLAHASSHEFASAEKDITDAQQLFHDPSWPPAPLTPGIMFVPRPELEMLYLAEGKYQLERKEGDRALTAYDLAARHSNNSTRSLLGRAEAQRQMGQLHGALRTLEPLGNNIPSVLRARGNILNRLGKYAEALAAFNRALSLAPNNDYALSGRGEAHRMLGDRKAARADFELARQLNAFSNFASQGLELLNVRFAALSKPKPRW